MAIEQIQGSDTPNQGAGRYNALVTLLVDTGLLLTGSGVPAVATGTNGQHYFDTATSDLYYKSAGAWTLKANLVNFHTSRTDNPHAVAAAQVPVADSGANYVATDVEGALAEEADARQAHEARADNPHTVTRAQLGAAAQADLDAHTGNTANPHAVAAAQVSIADAGLNFVATEVEAALAEEADARQAHEGRTDNPHAVAAGQVGIADTGANYAATDVEAALAEEADARQAHEARTDNPHAVAAAQVGIADTGGNFVATQVEAALAEEADARQAHEALTSNPHAVTAAQAGAVANAGDLPNMQAGTLAARPAASAALNMVYIVKDSDPPNAMYRSNGTEWQEVGNSGQAMARSVNQVAHGFVKGNIVRRAAGSYALATADTAANAEVVGIVESVKDADNFTILIGGYIDGLSGLTANDVHFLQDAGGLGITAGTISKPLLIADTTTSGFFFNFRGIAAGADAGNSPTSGVYASRASGPSVPSTTWTNIQPDTVERDTLGMYDSATGIFTAPETGWYIIQGLAVFSAFPADKRALTRVYKNGTAELFVGWAVGGASAAHIIGSTALYLEAGDTFTFDVYQDSGSSFSVAGARISVVYVPVGYGSIDDANTGLDNTWSGSKIDGRTKDLSARVYHSVAQSIPNATDTALTFDSEKYDTGGFHDAVNPTRLTAPEDGLYAISGHFKVNGMSAGNRLIISVKLNTATPLGYQSVQSNGSWDAMSFATTARLSAGDYVELICNQSQGAAIDVVRGDAFSPEFTIARISQ